jgi:hypothetical protein
MHTVHDRYIEICIYICLSCKYVRVRGRYVHVFTCIMRACIGQSLVHFQSMELKEIERSRHDSLEDISWEGGQIMAPC